METERRRKITKKSMNALPLLRVANQTVVKRTIFLARAKGPTYNYFSYEGSNLDAPHHLTHTIPKTTNDDDLNPSARTRRPDDEQN